MSTTTTTGAADVALQKLTAEVKGARGAVLATADGRAVGSALGPQHDPSSTAAIIASSRGLGDRLAELRGAGELYEIVVRSSSGYVVVYAVGDRGVLTVLTDSATNLALLHLRARDAIPDMQRHIDEFVAE